MSEFNVNPARRVSVVSVGHERLPVISIDAFSLDPAALIAVATEAVFIDVGSVYPGVRAPVPQSYIDAMLSAVAPLIEQAFGAPPELELDLCAFSMVTTLPARLRTIQRIPHFDGPDTERIAFLHYLCAPYQGGTSFYRHRATGLESVTRERVEEYRNTVVAELKSESQAEGYVADDTRFFERVHRVEAAFNRLIIYKGNALHSGDINERTVLSEDPRKGRLTVNGFGLLASRAASAG
ncbi:MAG TPA: DUF6445 family protein [Steroidobacteraceae bacterium]|nr:DUF6445 family protein [Steroidobacteraceae bacterium]